MLDLSVPCEAAVWLDRYDLRELQILQRLISPGHTFVDCGANIGLWTLTAAARVGPCGLVHAFEPHPGVFDKLARNVAVSEQAAHVELHRLAIGREAGILPFKLEAMHDMSRIVSHSSPGNTIVEVTTLDAVLAATPVHGIKLDVEGFELEALHGAERVLIKQRPWLCVELNTSLSGVDRLADWDVHAYLSRLGFAARRFGDALEQNSRSRLPDTWRAPIGHCNLYYASE